MNMSVAKQQLYSEQYLLIMLTVGCFAVLLLGCHCCCVCSTTAVTCSFSVCVPYHCSVGMLVAACTHTIAAQQTADRGVERLDASAVLAIPLL